jgi:tetratricopeptide (TPR) repeat protein
MDERAPRNENEESAPSDQKDLTAAAVQDEKSNSEVAVPDVSAGFESVEGRNVQQGSRNTMIVHNYVYSLCNAKAILGGAFVTLLVSVVIVGYHYSETTVNSQWLPSVAPGFTGREIYVNDIVRKFSYGDTPSVLHIVGAPGSGKSTLAIAVGHELLGNGIHVLYVDLNHIDDDKLAVTAILSAVIDSAESPDLQQLYRWASRLRTRRVLILDNCDSLLNFDDQRRKSKFLDFVSKLAGCSNKLTLLMTSRYQFTILDSVVETLEIGPLSEDASHTLLQSMYSHLSRANSSSLAELTGRNALALKVTGALLKEGVSLSDLVKELRSNPIQTLSPDDFRPEEQVRACISSSFNRLPISLRVALVTLAYVPGTFDESDASFILNVTNSTLHGSLPRKLRKRCLLEYDRKSKKYHLHSLISAYAKEEGTTYIKPLTAEKSFVRCYFQKLKKIVDHYKEAPLQALKRYDLDQQNFYHLFTMLIYPPTGLLEGDDLDSRAIITLARASAGLLDARMSPSRRIMWYRTALTRSKTILYSKDDVTVLQEDKNRYCHLFYLLIKALARRGDVVNATMEVKQQKRHLAFCNEKYRVLILMTVCLSDSVTGGLTEEHLECHRQMSEPLLIPSTRDMKSLHYLGDFYSSRGYISEAYSCYRSYKLKPNPTSSDSEFQDPLHWAIQSRLMLKTYCQVKKEEEFISKWQKWFRSSYNLLISRFKVSLETARELYDLGLALHGVSNADALQLLLQSEKMQTEVLHGDDVMTLLTLRAIGHVYFNDENYTLAADYYNRSLSMSKRIPDINKSYTANLLVYLGNALEALKLEDAINYWKQASEIRKELRLNVEAINLLHQMAKWHSMRGELYTAYSYYVEAYHIAKTIDSKDEYLASLTSAEMPTSSTTELRNIDGMLSTTNLIHLLGIRLRSIFDFTGRINDFTRPPPVQSDTKEAINNAYYRYYGFLVFMFCSLLITLAVAVCIMLFVNHFVGICIRNLT